ncbi:MAG: spermidine/putrescine ABC transporter substrate-binding protein [Roseiflexaceae bacterium]|nr:spermidine/putrescine ABC transporter substrate-binding protein [Roseiflexaceae bacterium]
MLRWVGVLLAALTVLAGCGGAGTSGGGTLYVYTWSDYTDPEVVQQFESENNVKVVLDTFDTNEDMIAKVRVGNSGYDLVVPSDYAVEIMIQEGLLATLDQAQLPNIKNILPENLGLYFDESNTYSVPYLYGLTGIAYNKTAFPTPPDSWAALFDIDQLQPFAGKVSMLDDEREAPASVLRFLGESVNETDPAVLQQVQDVLIAQKPLLTAYNSNDVQRKLIGGEYVIAQAYNGMAIQAILGLEDEFPGDPNIGWVMPKEGGVIWQDNLAIVKDSPNAALAHKFIDFTMRPDVAAKNAIYVNYLTPNAEAVKQLPQEVQDLYAQGLAPDAAMYERLERVRFTEASSAFTDVWTAVKGE